MTDIAGEIIINRPVGEVFDFVADERNEPRYNPRLHNVEKLSDGPIGLGTRYKAQTMTVRGHTADMVIEVTGYHRPLRLESLTRMAVVDFRGDLTFESVGGSTLMRWSWDVLPHGAFRLARPLITHFGRRQEQEIWTGLKRYLEGTR